MAEDTEQPRNQTLWGLIKDVARDSQHISVLKTYLEREKQESKKKREKLDMELKTDRFEKIRQQSEVYAAGLRKIHESLLNGRVFGRYPGIEHYFGDRASDFLETCRELIVKDNPYPCFQRKHILPLTCVVYPSKISRFSGNLRFYPYKSQVVKEDKMDSFKTSLIAAVPFSAIGILGFLGSLVESRISGEEIDLEKLVFAGGFVGVGALSSIIPYVLYGVKNRILGYEINPHLNVANQLEQRARKLDEKIEKYLAERR